MIGVGWSGLTGCPHWVFPGNVLRIRRPRCPSPRGLTRRRSVKTAPDAPLPPSTAFSSSCHGDTTFAKLNVARLEVRSLSAHVEENCSTPTKINHLLFKLNVIFFFPSVFFSNLSVCAEYGTSWWLLWGCLMWDLISVDYRRHVSHSVSLFLRRMFLWLSG